MRGDTAELICPPVLELLEPRVLLSADALPQADWADVGQLVAGNNAFAFDLYQTLRGEKGSLFFSPLSISSALAMTYAGAAGETAEQMADVLHFTLPDEHLHTAFGDLIRDLTADRASGQDAGDLDAAEQEPFVLDIANSLWGQEDYPFLQDFLDTVIRSYDSPLRRLDFFRDPEGSRNVINQWVSDQTRDRINDLLKSGDIKRETRLVLANAVYFNASWEHAFDEGATRARVFHLPDADVTVEMMRQTEYFRYGEGEDYQAVELPYAGGDAAMVILLPREGRFAEFEQSLSAETMQDVLGNMSRREVQVTMPKFEYEQEMELSKVLSAMGMATAFNPLSADFSGMNGYRCPEDEGLYIGRVRHKAWIGVDEASTEAAAATAVVMGAGCAVGGFVPPVIFTADRPFIYTICDTRTGSTLFMGRISDASVLEEADEGATEHTVVLRPPLDLKPIGPLPIPPKASLPPPEDLIVEPTPETVASDRWPAEVQLLAAHQGTAFTVLTADALPGEAPLPLPSVTTEMPAAAATPAIQDSGLEADGEGPLDAWSDLAGIAASQPAAEPDLDLGVLALEPLEVLASDVLTPALSV